MRVKVLLLGLVFIFLQNLNIILFEIFAYILCSFLCFLIGVGKGGPGGHGPPQ